MTKDKPRNEDITNTLGEGLIETQEILSDKRLMKSIKKSLKDVQENRVYSYKELLAELDKTLG